MREFKKRRTKGAEVVRVLIGLTGVTALAFVAFGLSRGAFDMYGKFAEAAAARSNAELELMELRSRHAKVVADVEGFATERGLEEHVRERYGVARPGEGQIDIVRQASTSPAQKSERSVLGQLWDLLFVW